MRSGTSEEQLLEQQELELIRKRQLLLQQQQKKKFSERTYGDRTIREHTIFYTTATLVFITIFGAASILFLVPLYVDPAISTLMGDFAGPTMCQTTRREDLLGLMNCSWSSCREGCTSDVFKCTHIYVQFVELIDDLVNFTFPYNATRQELYNLTTEIGFQQHDSVLSVNIKGCGYPPTVKCSNFTSVYGYEGAIFPCFYSKINKTVVMTNYNRDDQVNTIIHFFIVPFIITSISSIALCATHCKCNCKKQQHRRPKYRRSRIENLSDTSISTRVDCMLTPAIEVNAPPL